MIIRPYRRRKSFGIRHCPIARHSKNGTMWEEENRAMTTIDDIQDLFRLLAANPEYREEMRRYVLTEELLNLPARFNRFEERFDSFVRETRQDIGELRQDIGEVRRDISEIKQDMSQIKGGYARDRTISRGPLIAIRMGFKYVRTLTVSDLAFMVQDADTSGIASREIDSFIDADLVMETTDQDGQTVYIAVEISYTANRQDTRRAIRNAEFLSRFTGQPARPAIASVRNDPEIADRIASGEVHWHAIRERDLEPT